jgi:hypothetical protein
VPRIHVIGRDNGAGLSRDIALVAGVLRDAGFDVEASGLRHGGARRLLRLLRMRAELVRWGWRDASLRRFDLNLLLERLWADWLPLARRNALLPNPEWYKPGFDPLLPRLDAVLTKTRHAQALFAAKGCPTRFTGFTSDDRRLPDVPREAAFLHVAGRSINKGTESVLAAWRARPDFPSLTLVQRKREGAPPPAAANLRVLDGYLADAELRTLQNRHLFHLCPSETEGFGHHLVEAMSVGALVLTTDAEPMNELVGPDRGILVPYARTGVQRLATTYFVTPEAVAAGVDALLALDPSQRAAMGAAARAWYEANDRAFRERLVAAVRELVDR